jgi:hypothetical protein
VSDVDEYRRIGRLIDTLVPDLPSPPDRIAAVGGRLRRKRARTGALALACLALSASAVVAVLRYPADTDAAPVTTRVECPATGPMFGRGNGTLPRTAPGDLARAGAVRAVMCAYQNLVMMGTDGSPLTTRPPGLVFPRALELTRGVDELIRELNLLPAEEGIDACGVMSEPGVLVLEYDRGVRQTIELSGQCNYIRRGAVTRYGSVDAVTAFNRLFVAQELATATPAAITATDCTSRLSEGDSRARLRPAPMHGRWLYGDLPLAVVTACRYVRDSDTTLALRAQVIDRGSVADTDRAVEEAFVAGHPFPLNDCLEQDGVAGTIDVLILRDVLDQTVEVRILRDTCDVVTTGMDSSRSTAGLRRVADTLLGPPA